MSNVSSETTAAAPHVNSQQQQVRQDIQDNAGFTVPFVTMNALATVVACYGLLSNSTAVVIGAMIIALLLGPISGIALALVDGDSALLRQSLLAELGGVLVVLTLSFGIGKLHHDSPLTAEILARTSPNILDLMIALAGGAAGAYATISPRVKVGLVGVAIATALVPPLATCGLCLARGNTRLAMGGFLLFFANLIAIQFASSLVMWLHGYHKIIASNQKGQSVAARNALSAVLLAALAVSLSLSFSRSLAKQRFETAVRAKLEQALEKYPGVYLADIRFSRTEKTELVVAVVRSPYSFVPRRVAAIERQLPAFPDARLELHIRSVLTKEASRDGYLHELPEEPAGENAPELNQ